AVSFYVVFVNGYYKDDAGTVDKTRVGIAVGNRGIIAIFKPVIAKSGAPQFVEQLALVHELGHAVGFVNNGIPINTQHQDAANGVHCTNKQCAMHVANETADGAVEYVVKYFISEGPFYGQECLSDARILENKLQ